MTPELEYTQPPAELEEQPAKLPVHLPTLLIGVRSRLRILAAAACVALVMGAACARLIGKKSYETTTVLLYKTPPSNAGTATEPVDPSDSPTLLTEMDMVKIPENLEETRRRLGLKESIEKLGKAITVEVPINSELMSITVTWPKPDQAAAIANTLRDAFLQKELTIRRVEAANQVRDLVDRQDKVMAETHIAEQNLKDFTVKNHVVDLDKEAGWYLQQLINTELVYEEAVGQNKASQLQQANVGKIAENLQQKVRAEEEQVNSDPANRLSVGVPESQVDAAIRGRIADLKMKELEMDRAKTLADDGIYSRRAYEEAKAAYESERFTLYKDSPSAGLLKEMTLRQLDVQLTHISDQQKVAHLKEAVDHVHQRLDALPLVQREYMALLREVTIRADERERINLLLGIARRHNESQSYDFDVVAPAKVPMEPLKSNRRLVFAAVFLLITGCGFLVMLALEVVDRRLHCIADARAKLDKEVVGGYQHGALLLAEKRIADETLILTNKLRTLGLKAGMRVMVVSATIGEGAPEVSQMLAQSLAASGDSVLLVDAQFRAISSGPEVKKVHKGLRKRIEPVLAALQSRIVRPALPREEQTLSEACGVQQVPGLSDGLCGAAAQPVQLQERVRLLPAGSRARPELLLSTSLGQQLQSAAFPQDITLVQATPLLDYPDATFLAKAVSHVVLVAACGNASSMAIHKCARKLEEAGASVLGVIVTNIAPIYAAKDAA